MSKLPFFQGFVNPARHFCMPEMRPNRTIWVQKRKNPLAEPKSGCWRDGLTRLFAWLSVGQVVCVVVGQGCCDGDLHPWLRGTAGWGEHADPSRPAAPVVCELVPFRDDFREPCFPGRNELGNRGLRVGQGEERLVLRVVVLRDDALLLARHHERRETSAGGRLPHHVEDFPSEDGAFTNIATRDWLFAHLRVPHLDAEAAVFDDEHMLQCLPLHDEERLLWENDAFRSDGNFSTQSNLLPSSHEAVCTAFAYTTRPKRKNRLSILV